MAVMIVEAGAWEDKGVPKLELGNEDVVWR
jgi:hypothetical protein